jgi:PAS domain S-box-containing protein
VTLEHLLLLAFGGFAVVGLPRLWQPGRSPLTLWMSGWISASIGGLLVLQQDQLRYLPAVADLLGSLFAWLLLAGALLWAGRPATRALLTIGVLFGSLRCLLASKLGHEASFGLALAVEPALVLGAAWVVWRAPRPPGGPRTSRILALSLVALAIVGAAHVYLQMRGVSSSLELLSLWFVAAPPLLAAQFWGGNAWTHRALEEQRAGLEERVRERTQELARANASLQLEVAERRKAEAALRASRERWRAVSELGSDLAFSYRILPGGKVVAEWLSGAMEKTTGYSSVNELQPGDQALLIPAEDREGVIGKLPLETGGDVFFRHRIVRKDGAFRWMDTRFRVIPKDADGSVRVLGAARDVTDQLEAEEQRRLLEARVQDGQRLESLGLLTGTIAHDFNNLLTVILGNARLAVAGCPKDSPLARRLGRVLAAAEHGAGLTEQLLIYAGRGSPVRKPADLSRVAWDTLDLLRVSLPVSCELRHELLPGAWAEVDETQIRQMLLNLVTNAGDAIGERPGIVTIRSGTGTFGAADLAGAVGASDPAPGRYAYVEVADTGQLMDRATQRRAFEPFFTTRLAGRGLGLAAVLGIVRGHGGVVRVTSEPGKGTVFCALIPSVGEPLSPPAERGATPHAPRVRALGSGRVLVVDDEEAVLEVAAEFLDRAGFDVVTATSGREALARFAAEPGTFAAAVIDLAIPDLAGERVAAELRALRPDLPLVLASGFGAEMAAARCLELGASRFQRKPYTGDELARALHEAIGDLD